MNAVLVLIGRDLRRSWRPLLGIVLVVFVGSTSVMVALAGARRADTSYDRFRTAAVDGHAYVGVEDAPDRIDEVAELPIVEAFAPFGYVPIVPAGAPDEASIEGGGFASIDGRWLYDVGLPRVLMGRMPDPDESTQMVVNEVFAKMFEARVGDVVPMEAATPDAIAGIGDRDAVVTVDVQVAAVVRTMMDVGVNVGGPLVYLPPGFLRAHPEVGFVRGFSLVRLIDGDASFPELEAAASTTFADEPSFTAILISNESRTIQRALDVQVTALLCVAAVAAAASAALLLQVTSRRIRRTAAASLPLRSIGATRAQRIAVLAAPPLAAAVLGIIAGTIASVVLSSELPSGLARVAEPDPGRYLDGAVLAGVGLAALLLTVGCTVLVALATGRTTRPGSSPGALGDRLVRGLHGVGAPLSAMTGLRFALPSRRGSRQLGGVASLAGLIVGLAGVIAATSFGARLTEVAADSGAWGTPFDLWASLDDPDGTGEREASQAAGVPGVAAVTTVQYVEVLDLGDGDAPGYGVQANLGDLAVTSVEGHVPRSNGEVLLGTRTAQTLDVGVNDTMRLPTTDGEPVELTVVGLGLLPVAGDGSYDTGVVVLQPTFDRLRHDQGDRSLWVGLADGADVDRVVAALNDAGTSAYRMEPPSEQRNLQSALGYPGLVATIVALLALAGLGSALLAGASSRRLELATLRAFGFSRRQVLESSLWQSAAVVLIGLGLAVPLGFLVANATWGTFADSLHLDRSLPYAWGVALTVSGAIFAVAVAAAVPLGMLSARDDHPLLICARSEAPMSASWYWARASLRRNLGGVALLTIVLAIGAGGAMGAAAGARRGASAGDRLAAHSAVPEALVYANDAATFDAVTDLPEVAAATGFAGVGLQPQQVPCSDEDSSYFPTVVQVAGEPFAVPQPRLMAGRFADQADPREAVLSEQHARRLGVGVGDRVRYVPFLLNDQGEPIGCGEVVVAEVTVVGIVRELFEIGSDEPTHANTYLTAAFAATHPDLPNPGYGVIGFVDLEPGGDVQAFAEEVARRAPADENGEPLAGTVIGMALSTNALQPALDAGAAGLWALAAVVALVAATVLAFGIARQAASAAAELRVLAVIGMRRRDRVAAAAALGVAIVCLGLPAAMALAATLSTVHLVGLAAIVEPEPGFDLDLGVFVVGVLAAAAIGGGTVAVIAVRASAAAGRLASDEGSSARPGIAERLGSVGAPPWAVLGTSYALGRGRGTRVPARSALVGVLVGTAGGLAVLLFGLGVSRASTDPRVYGWGTWDAVVSTDDDESTPEADSAEVLLGDRDVATVALVQVRFKLELDGEVTNGLPVENMRGRSGPTVVDGRLPVGPSEIALGSDTADSLRVHIGSSIDVAGPDGTTPLEVVGIVALVGFDGDPLASGWTTDRAAIDALGWPPGCNDEAECFQTIVAGWRDGADDDALLRRLSDAGLSVDLPHPGGEVLLIAEADGLPGVAAGVVALVAAVGLAHTLTVTAARRRRELAVVRSLGFDRAQVRRVLHAEGLVLGVVGGLVGCVAGVVVGGLAWRAAARAIGIGPALPSASGLVAAVFAVVVALGLLLSIVPARLAARTSPAEGLRDP